MNTALAYWSDHLKGAPAALELVTDRVRPAVREGRGDRIDLALSPAVAARLRQVSADLGVPSAVTLMTALHLVLGRYAAVRDVSVGTPAKPTLAQPDDTMLVLRARWTADTSFADLVASVCATWQSASAHPEIPLAQMVAALVPVPDPSRTPLFQVAMVVTGAAPPTGSAPYDLFVGWVDAPSDDGRISGWLDYDVALFDRGNVARLAEHYLTLLESALADPDARAVDLDHTTVAERDLVAGWSVAPDAACAATVVDAFRACALTAPDSIALRFDDATLTYADLRNRSEGMARALIERGVTAESVVALSLERSAEMVVAMLAVATAGAAYLPLDPGHPPDRLAFMVRDSGAALMLAGGEPHFPVDVPVVLISDLDVLPAAGVAPLPAPHPEQRACVLYTSGSTGRPKGVETTHRGIARLVCDAPYLGFTAEDVVAQAANTSFDAASLEIWGALCNGACLAGLNKDEVVSPTLLADALRDRGVTAMFLTTAVFHHCADTAPGMFAGLRVLFFGGEQADARRIAAVRAAVPHLRLVNGYGPTEATTFATTFDVVRDAPRAARVPIGTPIAGTTVHVLDERGRDVGTGVPGELYIGGSGLARGYAGRPDLTADRFIPSPFVPGERLYRTGDVVRRRADGLLKCLGRADSQVKIRGVRIEPEEIASVLTTCPGVRAAFVDVLVAGDERRLVAYFVTEGAAVERSALRTHLAARLPAAMVPAWYVLLPEIPVTPNGKVNRRALPAPTAADGVRVAPWAEPRGATERLVARVWAELLGLPAVSATDDFFALGGHSLLAAQMVTRVAERLGITLSVRAGYEASTVAQFAALADATGHPPARPPVEPVGDVPHPLSFAQQGLWFLDRLAPGLPLYNVPLVLDIDGPLDVVALQTALHGLIERHATLRTRLVEKDGELRQVADVNTAVDLPMSDLRELAPAAVQARVEQLTRQAAEQPFDLAAGPLLRLRLLRSADQRWVLLVTLHHTIFDGWSVGVLIRDLGALYAAAAGLHAPPLPPLAVQYADFAHWQRRLLADGRREDQLAYWKNRLADAPVALELPTDHARPAVPRYAGDVFPVRLPAAVTRRLDDFAREHGVTRFMLLLAAFQLVLGRYAGVRDVSVGAPVFGRTRPELEDLIGHFVNTLVIRTRWARDTTFRQLLNSVRDATLDAYEHQDVPFEQVVDAVRPDRAPGRSPLFQVMLSMQNVQVSTDALPGLAVVVRESTSRIAKFDLTVAWEEIPAATGELLGSVEYDIDLFDRATVERMTAHYLAVIEAALDAPAVPVSRLDVIGDAELTAGFRPPMSAAADALHELIEVAAACRPHHIAVRQETDSLRYAELATRSDRVARYLAGRGVRPGDTVAVRLERSTAWPVALIGVLKAGAAFLPLDVAAPPERAAYLLADSRAVLVLGSRSTDAPAVNGLPFVALEDAVEEAAVGDAVPPLPRVHRLATAYVLYTSGTTGRPRGVCVSHANLVHTLSAVADRYELTGEDRVLQFAALTFDVMAEELFATLIRGATVVLPSPGPVPGIDELTTLARRELLSVLNLPASYWHEWVSLIDRYPPTSCPALRLVVVGSERVDASSLVRWQAAAGQVRWLNAYGPTEATITATVHEPKRPTEAIGGTVPIGLPLPGVRAYVLDDALRPAPSGTTGELYLGGPGVALGYLSDPASTAAAFLPDPWGAPGDRMYATGDRARRLPGGVMDFLGRGDDQVKLRGFRIELGEVEAALVAHPAVREAAVLLREDTPGHPKLVGYVSLGRDLPVSRLREHLSDRLPGYMVPSGIVVLDQLPRSDRGKIDRPALPAPATTTVSADERPGERPDAGLAGTIAAIWCQVLAVPQVGHDDNFFDAGGTSLLLIRVQARLAEALGRPVPVVDLFRFPTVRSLAQHLAVDAVAPGGEAGRRRAEARRSLKDARTSRKRPSRTRDVETIDE